MALITGAASIAGIVRLTQAWADFGTTLGNQAARAGVSADALYTLQNAARLAGVDAGTLTASLTTLNDHMRDAAFGAAPSFLVTLRSIGLSFEELQRQKPEDRLRTIADALNRVQNPTDRALYTREMFGGEGMQAFLQGGAEGIARYEQQARRLAGVFSDDDVRRANEFRQAQQGLVVSIQGLANTVSSTLGPALVPVLDTMSNVVVQARKWVEANQEWLRNEISAKVGEFVTWLNQVDWVGLGQWIANIAKQANAVAEALGGWETVGKGVLAFFVGRWLIGMLAPFATLGLAVGKLTWMIGVGLVASLRAAGLAAEAFNTRAMALPVFRILALTLGTIDTMRNGIPVDQLPADSPLRRVGPQEGGAPQGSEGGGMWGGLRRFLGLSPARSGASGGPSQDTNSATRAAFLSKWGPQAARIAGIVGTSPQNILAHWAQETGWGTHEHDNNVGNLQAAAPGANTVTRGDTHADGSRYSAPFFAFSTPEAAADAYASWVVRHGAAGPGEADSAVAFGNRLRNARYMENPNAPADIARTRSDLERMPVGAPPFDPGRPSLTAPRYDPRLPDASGAPAALPSSQPGTPGANGKVDMNVRVLGQPAVVTSRTSGDVDLKVVSPALTGY